MQHRVFVLFSCCLTFADLCFLSLLCQNHASFILQWSHFTIKQCFSNCLVFKSFTVFRRHFVIWTAFLPRCWTWLPGIRIQMSNRKFYHKFLSGRRIVCFQSLWYWHLLKHSRRNRFEIDQLLVSCVKEIRINSQISNKYKLTLICYTRVTAQHSLPLRKAASQGRDELLLVMSIREVLMPVNCSDNSRCRFHVKGRRKKKIQQDT